MKNTRALCKKACNAIESKIILFRRNGLTYLFRYLHIYFEKSLVISNDQIGDNFITKQLYRSESKLLSLFFKSANIL